MIYFDRFNEEELTKIIKFSILGSVIFVALSLTIIIFFSPVVGSVFGFFSKHENDKIIAPQAAIIIPRFTNLIEATNKDTISLKGYSNPGAIIKIYVNGPEKGSVVADLSGEFTFDNISLIKGRNSISARSVFENKESEKTENFNITLDKDAPKLELASPNKGETIKNLNSRILFQGKVNEKAHIFINGKRAVQKPDFSFEYYLGVKEGTIKIEVKVVDLAGNEKKEEFDIKYQKTSY